MHTLTFLDPSASQLQWLLLTMSEAALVAICLSRCIMTASPVCSGQCSLWCKTEGGGEAPGRRRRERERWCEKTDTERQRWSLCVGSQVLYLLKGEKCCTSQSRMSHQQYTSRHEHFSFTWGKGVYRLCVCPWFNLRKLVRYWTLHHVINLTLPAEAFRLSLERCDKNAQAHTCSHTTRNVLMHYSVG